jgi:hypothetical protein
MACLFLFQWNTRALARAREGSTPPREAHSSALRFYFKGCYPLPRTFLGLPQSMNNPIATSDMVSFPISTTPDWRHIVISDTLIIQIGFVLLALTFAYLFYQLRDW